MTALRTRALAIAMVLAAASPAAAAPRDDLLRVAPQDAALFVLVQNAREHVEALAKSPFARWFPQSALGKQLLAGVNLVQMKSSLEPVITALGVQPAELLSDVLGDAVAFAYTPGDPKTERAVLLIRPRKPDTLTKLIARLNELQTASGEVKAVMSRRHRGQEYFERQKPGGGSDFYCFRGDVFAFSSTEPDILAALERDPSDQVKPALAVKLNKLGVADAFAIALVNPRSFDSELESRVATAQEQEKALLARFREAWLALDSAAVYLDLNADLELGVSVQFQTEKTPAWAKGWLTGPRSNPAIWQAIPENALAAVAGRFQALELVNGLTAIAPANAPNSPRAALETLLGPVFGKDRLPQVLAALGPQWAAWIEPPGKDAFLPTGVAAVQVDVSSPQGKAAAKDITRALGFGFNAARVAYNASHADQIDVIETDDGTTSLVNDKGFPAGFRPSFALKDGFILVATSPEPIRRFALPKTDSATGEATVLRVSGRGIRDYLQAHGEQLARFLAAAGHGPEDQFRTQFSPVASVLELIDRVDLVTRGDASGLRVTARLRLAKPLK